MYRFVAEVTEYKLCWLIPTKRLILEDTHHVARWRLDRIAGLLEENNYANIVNLQFLPDQHIVGQNTSPGVAGSWLGSSLSAS